MGSTRPRTVISPVMATSPRTGMLVSALADAGRDGDAGRRAVLRNRALGNVQVNVQVAVEIARQSELMRARADVAHGRLRRFLHHVAQFAGDGQLAAAFHDARLRW